VSVLDRIARFERDLVVKAGAGTGKTHALVTLYLHLVGGVTAARLRIAPPRIAVVTFTDKAAGELKERIRLRLGHVAEAEDAGAIEKTLAEAARDLGVALPDRATWQEALLQLGAAPIGTFHSFAGTLLRRHAARAALDPDFTLLDEAEAQARATQAAERAVLDALSAGDEDVEELVAEYGYHSVGRGRGLVEQLVELRARRAEEGRAGEPFDRNYDADEVARNHAAAVAGFTTAAARLRSIALELSGKSVARAQLCADLAAAADLSRADALDEFWNEFRFLRGPALDGVKSAIKSSGEELAAARTSLRAVPLARALSRLTTTVEASYRAHKRRSGTVDFSDLLVLARDLLRDHADVRMAVRSRFAVILVDEFQDTNPVQAELVELIGARQPDDESARLFVVGDRKQSIYEFRGADVAVFARSAETLVARGGEAQLLTQSRRSVPSLLALNNALFARALRGSGGGAWDVVYEAASDDLTPLRDEPAGAAGAELLVVAGASSAEARAREARAIARRIAQLRSDGRKLGDMAVLLRRFTHLTDYLDALRAVPLPYFVVRGRGFFAAQEIRDLASALTVLDNPDDLLALVALLRSPIVGVSDETLAKLSLAGQLRARVLLDRQTVLPPTIPHAERESLLRFRDQFRELRLIADRLGPAACAQAIVDGADLIAILAATTDGEQRVANLLRLVERARQFETSGGDLRAFVNWLRRAAGPGGEADAAEAQVADEKDDVVRVMTVHQAKGLEFPVVFVPSCGGNERLETAPIMYDADVGLGLRIRDERAPSSRAHTSASLRVQQVRRARQRAESLRLFYVAATRAKDLVVFSGEPVRNASATWRHFLDELRADDNTAPLLRVVDGDRLPALQPPSSTSPLSPMDEPAARARVQQLVARPLPRATSVTIAVTQLGDFQLCPRRYQQLHALGLSEHPASARAASPDVMLDLDDAGSGLDPLRRGTLAHRLLERARFCQQGADQPALDALLTSAGYDLHDPAVTDVRGHVAAFLDCEFARGLDGAALRRELPFLLAVPLDEGVLYLRGQMDLVLLSPEGVTVIDYKHVRQGDPDDYRFQLDAYALAARRLYPQAPAIRTGLAFLKDPDPSPRIIPAPPPQPFLEQLGQLGAALMSARARDSWDMQPLSTCHRLRCGFIYRCYPTER
jgi:ATP-dependent exoDNAse (exonuclease V) beta subunit